MPVDENRIPKQLGHTIRQLRSAQGISQIDLAEKAGLNHNFVGEIERGEALASVVTVVKLAAAFGLRGGDLMAKAKL
jgi:transcriptional regulator with XRE-family HTH domain